MARLGVESFRPPACWPGPTPVDAAAPFTAYSSPVASSGMIGDFGLTVSTGTDPRVQDHLARVAELVHGLTEQVAPGRRYADLYQSARSGWEAAGLVNDIASSTDPAGTNIGHSIPFFGQPREPLEPGEDGARRISQARVFVSATNEAEIAEECAFTIEPRLGGAGVPVVWFHVVVSFVAGRKHVVTEFDPVLAAAGASWFENPWAVAR